MCNKICENCAFFEKEDDDEEIYLSWCWNGDFATFNNSECDEFELSYACKIKEIVRNMNKSVFD